MVFALPHDTVLISDGGLATELEARGHDLSDDLWSARLLVDSPLEIAAVHAAFFRAGAAFATTASYQASFDGFAQRGIGRDAVARLLRLSVELAKTARDEVGGDGWVAASVGPYGAALADGSEYRGRYGLTVRQLTEWHRPRLEVLADAGADVLADWHRPRLEVLVDADPDVLAIETVPDIDEALALVALAHELGTPAWLSYTIDGTTTRAGQPLTDAFAVAADVPEIVAVGVNCCAPDDVEHAISVAREITGKPVIVYPNSGEDWDGVRRRWIGRARWSTDLAPRWVVAGASIIGGCCRVRPDDIAALASALTLR